MDILQTQNEILKLKKKNDICILAHSYQRREITEIADFTGDSYALAKMAGTADASTVIMCGVRFMAETVKILSPNKKVILANGLAGCPMAEQMDKELIEQMKSLNEGYAVVAYINTTAELKTVCDVCVTSSSAEKIIKKMPQNDIIFIPDINLGTYVKNKIPEKNIKLVRGGCPTHAKITLEEAKKVKNLHPDALLLVHPECIPEIQEIADYIGSTSGIMEYAEKSPEKEFIIGTENSIAEHLSFECPDKKFYVLSKDLVCHNMRITTLPDLLECCKLSGGEEINIPEDTRIKAKKCIDKMIEYGG